MARPPRAWTTRIPQVRSASASRPSERGVAVPPRCSLGTHPIQRSPQLVAITGRLDPSRLDPGDNRADLLPVLHLPSRGVLLERRDRPLDRNKSLQPPGCGDHDALGSPLHRHTPLPSAPCGPRLWETGGEAPDTSLTAELFALGPSRPPLRRPGRGLFLGLDEDRRQLEAVTTA